ncbi:MAG: transglycosylase SLT domain-containing protein [Pseudomonadota bacterium]
MARVYHRKKPAKPQKKVSSRKKNNPKTPAELLTKDVSDYAKGPLKNALGNFFRRGGFAIGNFTLGIFYLRPDIIPFAKTRRGYSVPKFAHHIGKGTADLYSAFFESAGHLIGKPKWGGRAAALGTAATLAALNSDGLFQNRSEPYHSRPVCASNDWQRSGDQFFSDRRDINFAILERENYAYNPLMMRQIQTDPVKAGYFELIVQSAIEEGINPVLFANQLYQESAGFRPDVVSGQTNSNKGAVGIAQFLPSTASRLYNATIDDLIDPERAIPLAARHMGMLTRRYNDQILGMIAYNAGDEGNSNALTFVNGNVGYEADGIEWMAYMNDRRGRTNCVTYATHAWHNETFKYVAIITGAGWSADTYVNALEQQASLIDFERSNRFAGVDYLQPKVA